MLLLAPSLLIGALPMVTHLVIFKKQVIKLSSQVVFILLAPILILLAYHLKFMELSHPIIRAVFNPTILLFFLQ